MKLTVKERPILFNGEMVRAILEGRKTQTRRPIKGQVPHWNDSAAYREFCTNGKCPYGQPGDRLWVRETWTKLSTTSPEGGQFEITEGERLFADRNCVVAYRANSNVEFCDGDGFSGEFADKDDMPHWHPSIHMPRWASRLLLEITAIRVERVQDISEADAKAEGVEEYKGKPQTECDGQVLHYADASFVKPFSELWNAAYPGSWERNDWVWAIEFRRIEA